MLLCNDLVHKLLDFFFVALIREMFLLGCDYASIMCGDLYAYICTNNKQSEHLGGPGHAFDGDFLPTGILSKAIGFQRPGGRE